MSCLELRTFLCWIACLRVFCLSVCFVFKVVSSVFFRWLAFRPGRELNVRFDLVQSSMCVLTWYRVGCKFWPGTELNVRFDLVQSWMCVSTWYRVECAFWRGAELPECAFRPGWYRVECVSIWYRVGCERVIQLLTVNWTWGDCSWVTWRGNAGTNFSLLLTVSSCASLPTAPCCSGPFLLG